MTHEQDWRTLFNRGEYIPAVLVLEQAWFPTRDDFYKGLIRVCVGVNQLRMGLDGSPQMLLTTAREMLKPSHPAREGVDLVALEEFIAKCLAVLDAQPGQPREVPEFEI